jgi:hypothetical protein
MIRNERINLDESARRRALPASVRRVLLAALAIGGTALYALSFRRAAAVGSLYPLAAAVGVAAAAAWVVFAASSSPSLVTTAARSSRAWTCAST